MDGAIVRATCPACGEVDLPANEVELRLDPSAEDDAVLTGRYAFTCPSCLTTISKDADRRAAELLMEGGAQVKFIVVAKHPENPPAGRALTWDDLLDLHVLLERDDWFELLMREPAAS